MFIKELTLYVNYLVDNINELHGTISEKQVKYFQKFRENLLDGIKYYHELFSNAEQTFQDLKIDALLQLEEIENTLYDVKMIIERNVLQPAWVRKSTSIILKSMDIIQSYWQSL